MGAIQQLLASYIAGEEFAYLLDDVTGATFAYSFRLLRSAYAGSCLRIRRSSDNSEQDIGFSNNELDTTSLLSFVGANDGFVVTWYDQSGNGNNASQATSGSQPKLVGSGTVITDGGLTTLEFSNSANQFMTLPTGIWNSASAITFLGVRNIDTSASSNGGVFAPSSASGVGFEIISNDGGSNKLRLNGTDRGATSGQLLIDDTRILTEFYGDGTDIAAYTNNSAVTISNTAAMPSLNFNGLYGIARYAGSSSNDTKMNAQEIIGYSSNKEGDRSTINTNINDYYSLY